MRRAVTIYCVRLNQRMRRRNRLNLQRFLRLVICITALFVGRADTQITAPMLAPMEVAMSQSLSLYAIARALKGGC